MSDHRRIAIAFSLAASVLMLAGKWFAFGITGSAAIFSDAAESVVHLAATAIAAFSLWYGGKPADSDHPFGHGKIQYFSAGFEGALVLVAAVSIILTATLALLHSRPLEQLHVGIAVSAGLGFLNLGLGLYLQHVGRRHNTFVLVANGAHVLSDAWTSLGVAIGVSLVWLTGAQWIDAGVALLVGVYVLTSGYALVRKSYHGLMDRADGTTSQRILDALQHAVKEGWISDFHQLRHRQTEEELWIQVHLLVHGDLKVNVAHERITSVENYLRECLPQKRILISTHLEPAEHELAHPGGHDDGDPLSQSKS